MVAIPIFMQRTTYQSIDERKFKRYKIKRLGFLFKGMQGESASTYGVILPMLVIQIQGYALGIMTFIFVLINETLKLVDESIGIVIIVLFIHIVISIITTIITGIVSKRRCGKKIYQDGIVIYTGTNNYLVIAKEKGLITHYCVDKNLTRAYVIKSQLIEKDIFDFNYGKKYKRYLTVDLSKYDCAPCPDWLKNILANQTGFTEN